MSVHPLVTALRRERERQHLTQQQIADRTGWAARTVHGAETGDTNPTLVFIDDYANALGLALTLVGLVGRRVVEVPERFAPRRDCPSCGNEYQVTRRGVIRKHGCTAKEGQ